MTRIRTTIALTAALALLAVPEGPAGNAARNAAGKVDATATGIVGHRFGTAPSVVRSYWTPQRMRNAVPLELASGPSSELAPGRASGPQGEPTFIPAGPPTRARAASSPVTVWPSGSSSTRFRAAGPIPYTRTEIVDPSVPPFRTNGKLFGVTGGGIAYDCSATALSSQNRSVVWTAGHCVFDESGWARFLEFVPGYRNGGAPFGEWPALGAQAPVRWTSFFSPSFDMAAIVVTARQDGVRLEDMVGGRGFAFNVSRDQQFDAFGYPGTPPFDGERLYMCDTVHGGDDIGEPPPPMAIGCDMKEGSSGGGWIIQDLYLNSNVSYGYPRQPEVLYGPYFGQTAGSLYQSASASTAPGPLPPTPPPAPLVGQRHEVRLSFRLGGHLKAIGRLTAPDGYRPCIRGALVAIFRKKGPGFKLVKRTHTNSNGAYKAPLRDVAATYRAFAPEGSVDNVNVCGSAQTPPRRHRH
ncbi:MAG TPA: hypothetical protein VG602_08290 [Actinomycetota bacterium]|nr:hypothetical protein [Actinomycetota bacterium]